MISKKQNPALWGQLETNLKRTKAYSSGQSIYCNKAAVQCVLETYRLLVELNITRAEANRRKIVLYSMWDFIWKLSLSLFLQWALALGIISNPSKVVAEYLKEWVLDEMNVAAAGGLTGREFERGPAYLREGIRKAGGTHYQASIPDEIMAQIIAQRQLEQQQQQPIVAATQAAIQAARQTHGTMPRAFLEKLNYFKQLQEAGEAGADAQLALQQTNAAAAAVAAAQQAAVDEAVAAERARVAELRKTRYDPNGDLQLSPGIAFLTYQEAVNGAKPGYLHNTFLQIAHDELPGVVNDEQLGNIWGNKNYHALRFIMHGNTMVGWLCRGYGDHSPTPQVQVPGLANTPIVFVIALQRSKQSLRIGMSAADAIFKGDPDADVADAHPLTIACRIAIGRPARRNGRHWLKRLIGTPREGDDQHGGTVWDGYFRYAYAKYHIDVRQHVFGEPSSADQAESESEDEMGGPAGGSNH